MILDGYLGANIRLGAGGGASTDNALTALAVMGGRSHVVVNDDVNKQPTPQYPNEKPLSRHIIERGGVVAARFTLTTPYDNARDDDADAKFRGDELADIQIDMMNKIGKHKNLWAYGMNEATGADPARLEEFLVTYLDRLGHNGYQAVVCNFPYLNPTFDVFAQMPRAVEAIRRWKAKVGFHEGTDRTFDTYAKAIASGAIGKALQWKAKYGFDLWLTEFAGSYGAHDGYKVLYEGRMHEWHDVLWKTAKLCCDNNIDLSVFNLFEWQRGFGLYNDPDTLEEIGAINRAYPYQELPNVAQFVNMREAACPATSPVRRLNTGEIVQTYWKGSIGYQGKNSQWEQFCIKVMGGVRWLCRLMDISEYLAAKQTVYALFEDEAMTKPGGAWCPEICEVGKVYPRDVWVQEFKRDGTKIPKGTPGTKTGRAVTYFKVVAVHPTWTTPEGVQVQNVAECVYGFDYNAIVAANAQHTAGTLERYFYSGGLVGFIDYAPGGIRTTLTPPPYPAALPAQIEIPWWSPQVSESVEAIPAGTNPYAARVIEASGVKLRPAPGTASGNLYSPPRVLPANATVTLYEKPVRSLNDYDWVRCESALGSGFVALKQTGGKAYFERVITPAPTPDKPVRELIKLPVPYYSQLDPVYAKGYRNDCGTTASKGVVDFVYVIEKGLLPPDLITVDDLSNDTDLKRADDGLGVGELVTLLKGYGIRAEAQKLLTPAKLIEQVRDKRKPVIILCTTKPLGTVYANEDICHFITVIGLIGTDDANVTGFIIHDPYRLGAGVWVTTENLVAAMTQNSKCSGGGIQQGVVLI